MDRKRWESGVRAVFKGKHVVTAEDVYEGVRKAEDASYKWKTKRRRKTHTPSNSSSSDVEVDMENNAELENREIADCIVVEF